MWFTFAYGKLVYDLLGEKVEGTFAGSWMSALPFAALVPLRLPLCPRVRGPSCPRFPLSAPPARTRSVPAGGLRPVSLLSPACCAVGLGIEQAVQWKQIVHEAVKAGLVLLILDGFNLMAPGKWLEEWMDLASVQARAERGWQSSSAGGGGLLPPRLALLSR